MKHALSASRLPFMVMVVSNHVCFRLLQSVCWIVLQVQKLAEKYFGGWKSMSNLPAGPSPVVNEPLPRPEGSRHFEQSSKAGPLLMQAYYRPSMTSSKAVVMEIIW